MGRGRFAGRFESAAPANFCLRNSGVELLRSADLPIGDRLYSELMPTAGGSFLLGVLLCWLLNLVEICIGLLLWFATERYLPAVYVLIYAVGLVQIGYVVPLWRLLERQGKSRAANGLMWAALLTLAVNLAANYRLFGAQMLPFSVK
jgi:hypothetical protein